LGTGIKSESATFSSGRQTGVRVKITVFGLTLSSSWGNGHATPYRAILRALYRRGHQATFFEKDVPYYAAHRDLWQPEFCELVFYDSWDQIKNRALRQAANSDIVITASYCPEGAHINEAVLGLRSPLKVYYDLDTPITLKKFQEGSAVDYLTPAQLSAFDLVLSWTGGRALAELGEKWGVRRAQSLYGCVDPDEYHRTSPSAEYACALSYMGTYAPNRQDKLDALFLEPSRRRPELKFLLAGSMYPWGWDWGANVIKTEHVPARKHPALYSSSRLTLNITRAEMATSGYCPSGRFFEAAACGTPVISDWFEGLDYFFHLDEEIQIIHSAEDVLQALAMPDDELRERGRRARERTLDEHTGNVRAEQLIRYCEQAASVTGTAGKLRCDRDTREAA
jgi:spore maturation protein CgeB